MGGRTTVLMHILARTNWVITLLQFVPLKCKAEVPTGDNGHKTTDKGVQCLTTVVSSKTTQWCAPAASV